MWPQAIAAFVDVETTRHWFSSHKTESRRCSGEFLIDASASPVLAQAVKPEPVTEKVFPAVPESPRWPPLEGQFVILVHGPHEVSFSLDNSMCVIVCFPDRDHIEKGQITTNIFCHLHKVFQRDNLVDNLQAHAGSVE
jgi:hypothetical protein